jgi:hypothetical protein
LDQYADEKEIARFRLVKVDTEGHDFKVLMGATGLLQSGRIDVVQFEYNTRWIDARCFLRDAFDLLMSASYRVGKVTPIGIEFYEDWHPELETFREGNYLACQAVWTDAFETVPWWGDE